MDAMLAKVYVSLPCDACPLINIFLGRMRFCFCFSVLFVVILNFLEPFDVAFLQSCPHEMCQVRT